MYRKRCHGAALAALLFTLAACGSGESNNSSSAESGARPTRFPGDPGGPGTTQTTQGTAEAEGINCSRAAGSGPDVVGVSIGMRAEDAYARIACSNRALRVEYSPGGLRVPAMPDGSRPRSMIVGRADGEVIEALLAGLPGQETVVFVRRVVTFQPDQRPQLATLRQQLLDKYGALAEQPVTAGFEGEIAREIAGMGSVVHTCKPPLFGGIMIYDNCGPSVAVRAEASQDNPQLVGRLLVAIADGSYGMRQIAAYHALANGAAQQQQSQQTEQAAERRPTL